MKELLGEYSLRNRNTNAIEAAQLYKGLDQSNHEHFANAWRPLLASKSQQDSHWDWVKLDDEARKSLALDIFAVECNGQTQGLMLINYSKFAQHPEQKGLELIYVDRVATAPWNRTLIAGYPRYKGVGRILIATAISASLDAGFKGRIGLHSLPQSLSWYREVGNFTDLWFDGSYKMQYFESTEAQSNAFLDLQGSDK